MEPGSSLFLTVKGIVKIVDLLDAPVTLRHPDHRLLVALDDLLRKGLKRRRKNCLRLNSRRQRPRRTLLSRRLIGLELGMPLCNLSSPMISKVGQVLV